MTFPMTDQCPPECDEGKIENPEWLAFQRELECARPPRRGFADQVDSDEFAEELYAALGDEPQRFIVCPVCRGVFTEE